MQVNQDLKMNFSDHRAVHRVEWLTRLAWVRFAALALLMVFLLAQALHAQDDSPKRLVRLTDVEGSVQVVSADNTDFPQALQNMPLLEGMKVLTGNDGRAEIEFEDGSTVRVAPNSGISLDQLSMDGNGYQTQLSISGGLVYLELRSTEQYSYHVTYSDGVFSPVENSTVRVNMDTQPAELAVLAGQVSLQRGSGDAVQVLANESLKADAENPARYFLTQSVAADSWDDWNADRDQLASQEASQQTTARNDFAGDNGYGWSDLDTYGNWYPVPGYGMMWQPLGYTAGFDPYGSGYWMDYPGYGYRWISAYPWGWTPYYCGNWDYVMGFGWGWMPIGGCRGYRFGFGWGPAFFGGSSFNIALSPVGYRFPIRPGPPTHGPHPVLAVGGGAVHEFPKHLSNGFVVQGGTNNIAAGAVTFHGNSLRPLQPVTSGQSSLLARDAPVNAETHTQILGRQTIVNNSQGVTPNNRQNNVPRNVPGPAPRNNSNQGRNGGNAPAPHYSPPPASSRPSYSGGGGASHSSGGGASHSSGGGGRH